MYFFNNLFRLFVFVVKSFQVFLPSGVFGVE